MLTCDYYETHRQGIPGVDGLKGDEYDEYVYCENLATGIILTPASDTDESMVATLCCNDHSPEMVHEMRQIVGRDEGVFFVDIKSIKQVQ